MTRAPEREIAVPPSPPAVSPGGIRGIHGVLLLAIVLAAIAARASEIYTTRYQTLPFVDWLESRPPLAESANLPAAVELARSVSRALPLLVIRDDARSRLVSFGPPATVQRTMGGVRDAARIVLGTPGEYLPDQVPVTARFDVIVFNRAARAAAWSQLIGRALDVRDPESGAPQERLSGPDEPFGAWVISPETHGGIATVAGHRGAVGFVLQVTLFEPLSVDPAQLTDASGRAENLARQAATHWLAWLAQQPSLASTAGVGA